MADDYLDAYYRHLCDAESLYNASRLANASHLFGISTECGLKCLINVFMNKSGAIKIHIGDSKFQSRYNATLHGYLAKGTLAQNFKIDLSVFFHDWKVEDRYKNQTDASFSKVNVDRHRDGAKKVKSFVHEAKKLGVI